MLCFRPSAKLLLGLIYFTLLVSDFFSCFQYQEGYTQAEEEKDGRKKSITTIHGAPTMYQELSHVLNKINVCVLCIMP